MHSVHVWALPQAQARKEADGPGAAPGRAGCCAPHFHGEPFNHHLAIHCSTGFSHSFASTWTEDACHCIPEIGFSSPTPSPHSLPLPVPRWRPGQLILTHHGMGHSPLNLKPQAATCRGRSLHSSTGPAFPARPSSSPATDLTRRQAGVSDLSAHAGDCWGCIPSQRASLWITCLLHKPHAGLTPP